jgi:hypothetical protein
VAATVVALPAESVIEPAGKSIVIVPTELGVGVTTRVATVGLTKVSAPTVPPLTIRSLIVKLDARSGSLAVTVKVTSPVATPGTLSVTLTVGGVVSGAVVFVEPAGGVALPPPQAASNSESASALAVITVWRVALLIECFKMILLWWFGYEAVCEMNLNDD